MRNKIIRIFISSTFEDMKRERDIIQQKIYPGLLEEYVHKGWQIEFVDLRWGISKEAGVSQKTMRICKEELERCQRISPRPNFLILSGQRYGWRPVPEIIPEREWNMLMDYLSGDGKPGAECYTEEERKRLESLLKEWYRMDCNNIPPVMELVERSGTYRYDYDEYADNVEAPLVGLFTKFGNECVFDKGEKYKYTTSATEQEIFAGALSKNVSKEQVIAYFRDITDAEANLDENGGTPFLDSPKERSRSSEAISNLRKAIKEKLGRQDGCRSYVELEFSHRDYVSGAADDEIEKNLSGLIRNVIDNEISLYSENIPEAEEERERQKSFIDDRVSNFIGRDNELDSIGQGRGIVVLEGESGTGKSAVMAKSFKNECDLRRSICVFRSAGIGRMSQGRHLLVSAIEEIRSYASRKSGGTFDGQADECTLSALSGLYPDKDIRMMTDEELSGMFRNFLQSYSGKIPVAIYFDAIDQLPENDYMRNMLWCPGACSANVKIVVSAIAGTLGHVAGCSHRIVLPGLASRDGGSDIEGLLDSNLESGKRTLTALQKKTVLDAYAKGGCKPLFLKIIAKAASRWRHDDVLVCGECYSETPCHAGSQESRGSGGEISAPARAVRRITLPDNTESLVKGLMQELEKSENYGLVVDKALSFILLSRYGVSDGELMAMLSQDEEFMRYFRKGSFHEFKAVVSLFPPIIWTRFYYEIRSLLTERIVAGGEVMDFYHRQVENGARAFVEERIGGDEGLRHAYEIIAGYFSGRLGYSDARSLEELPRALRKCSDYDGLFSLLCNAGFIQAKAENGFIFDLIEDFRRAADSAAGRITDSGLDYAKEVLSGNAGPRARMFFENAKLLYYSEILKAIGKFIRKEAYAFSDFAKLDPMFSVQLMYNAYCDGPLREAAEKYMASSGSIRSNLYLQSNSAPYQSNSVIRDKLQGHDWCVRDVAVSDDFKRALSVSDDSTCILWDLDTGIMLRKFGGYGGMITSVSSAGNLEYALVSISGSLGKCIIIDCMNGDTLWSEEFGSEIISTAFADDGGHFAVLRRDGAGNGRGSENILEFYSFKDAAAARSGIMHGQIGAFCFAPGGQAAYIAMHGGSSCPDPECGGLPFDVRVVSLPADDGMKPVRIKVSSDRKAAVLFKEDYLALDKGFVRIYDLDSPCSEGTLIGEGRRAIAVMDADPSMKMIAAGMSDNSICIFDTESGRCMKTLHGHAKDVTALRVSKDRKHLFSSSRDRRCIFWNLEGDEPVRDVPFSSCVCMTTPLCDGTLYAASDSSRIMFYEGKSEKGRIVENIALPSREAFAMDLSSDGSRLAYSSGDRDCYLIDTASGKSCKIADGVHDAFVNAIRFSPDGRYVVTNAVDEYGSSAGCILAVSDTLDGRILRKYTEKDLGLCAPWGDADLHVAEGKDGVNPVTGRYDRHLIEKSPDRNKYLVMHINSPFGAAFSPDGKLIAVACRDKSVVVYDWIDNKVFKHLGVKKSKCDVGGEPSAGYSFYGHSNEVKSVAFMPDGKGLISGSWDNSCILWDLSEEDGKEIKAVFKGHIRGVYALDVSKDGKTFVSGARDRSCMVWDIDRGVAAYASGSGDRALSNMFLQSSPCNSVYFRNEGIIAGCDEGNVDIVRDMSGSVLKSVPLATPVKMWNHRLGEYEELSFICPHCGRKHPVPERAMKKITEVSSRYDYPSVQATDSERRDRSLGYECPSCGNRLAFNPFIAG